MKHLFLILVALCGFGRAQQDKAKPPVAAAPASPPIVTEEVAYPLPLEQRDKIRDLQHEHDQIEIENQKMLVKVEQNKARQSALVDALKLAAFQFSQTKKIDLDLYEFDPAQIRFIKKKPAKQ